MSLEELEYTTAGGTRIYSEYRPDGKGGRQLIGYLVDNGKDRVQVPTKDAAIRVAVRMDITVIDARRQAPQA